MAVSEEEKSINPPTPSPQNIRRNNANQVEGPDLKFARKVMSDEKLAQLKAFLKNASAEDIKVIQDCYGDNPDVLELLGIGKVEEESEDS